jgi:nucleoid DNA-binding protein
MSKNQNKTQITDASVDEHLMQIEDEQKRADCFKIKEMMERIVGAPAQMWGTSIIGFGKYHYKYESGREGDFMRSGFAARKANIVLYIMSGFSEYDSLLEQMGKHKHGKGCLYIKRLSDIDESILEEIVTRSVAYMAQKYPE